MQLIKQSQYGRILLHLSKVSIDHYFAKSVLTGYIDGKVYVDDAHDPSSFYIVNSYGMSLLFGSVENKDFNLRLAEYLLNEDKHRTKDEWMQVYPDGWNEVVAHICHNRLLTSRHLEELEKENGSNYVILNSRVNFSFNVRKFREFAKNGTDPRIIDMDKNIFNQLTGGVVPKYFWKDADQFIRYGKGYSLIIDGNIVSTAYSSFIDKGILELGIETSNNFRGKGYASKVCQALLEHCLKNNSLPVWACRLENQGSYHLAIKLGFEPIRYLPYYRLCRTSA